MTGAFVGGLAGVLLPTHLLAVVAIGLVIGQGARLLSVHILFFAVGFAVGCYVIATAIRETPAPVLLLGCAALCGAVVLAAWRPPPVLTAALALIAGALIALNSPPQALTIRAAMVEQLGSATAALITLAIVIAAATKAVQPWQRIGARIIGSWIAASAILVLALRLAK